MYYPRVIRILDVLAYTSLLASLLFVPFITSIFSIDSNTPIGVAFFLALGTYILSQNLKLRYSQLPRWRRIVHLTASILMVLFIAQLLREMGYVGLGIGSTGDGPGVQFLFIQYLLLLVGILFFLGIMWLAKRSPTKATHSGSGSS